MYPDDNILDRPAPRGEGSGHHTLEDFRWIVDNRMDRFAFNQHPKHVAHVAAMKAKGIWPKDLVTDMLENSTLVTGILGYAQDVE